MTWSQKWNPDSEHPNIRRALIVEELIIHLKGAGATMHQLYSVIARAGQEEWILDSGASVPQLTSKGLIIRILKEKCAITGKQGHEMTVKKCGYFYSINCYTAQVAVTGTPKSENPRFPDDVKYSTELCLWHQRFGLLASKSIVSISIKRLVERLPELDHSLYSIAPLCTGCLLEKFHRRPVRPSSKKAGSVCEKFHMDIKGPMDMMSIGKHLYFLN